MNYKLFGRGAAGVLLAAVISLLGACASSPVTSQSRSAPPEQDSSGPVRYTWVTPGRNIPVDVIYDSPTFDER